MQVVGVLNAKFKHDYLLYAVIGINLISTCYSYYWDLIMDWGLFRTHEKGKKYLRPKIFYPAWFYYYAIVSNLMFRLFWIIPLIKLDPNGWLNKSQLIILILSVSEGFRRA